MNAINFKYFCTFISLVIISTLTCSNGASQITADEFLKIGSWNIQNLGDRHYGQDPKALAEHIQLAGVDILALQEIHDTDENSDTRTSVKLDQLFGLLNQHPEFDYEYALFSNRDSRDTARICGIAWNRRKVSTNGKPYRIPVKYENAQTWKRHPHAMKFSCGSGKSDIIIISVHMKSNHNVQGLPEPAEIRRAEAKALSDAFDSVRDHFKDDDIVITGDTNCLHNNEPALQIYYNSGFYDLNRKDAETYRDEKAPFDRIFVPKNESEFKFSRQYILSPADPGKHTSKLSDHYMVLAMIRIMEDDD